MMVLVEYFLSVSDDKIETSSMLSLDSNDSLQRFLI